MALTAGAGAATTSTQWQVDEAHTGYLYGAGVQPPLTQAWTIDLGRVNTNVAIDGGTVFAFQTIQQDSSQYPVLDLDAIDITNGRVVWSHQVNGMAATTDYLAFDGGRVFAATQYMDSPSSSGGVRVEAFDASTGAEQWTQTLPGDVWVPNPPVAHGGMLYVDGEGRGGDDFALDESTGKVLWQTGQLMEGNAPVLADSALVVAGVCQLRYGFAATSGKLLWDGSDNCDGGGTVMSAYDGTQVWSEDTYGGGGDDTGTIYNPANGDIVARFPGFAPAFGYGEAVQEVVDNANGNSGPTILRAFDPTTQKVRWSFTEPTEKTSTGSAPLLADGSVFAEGPEGQLWAFDPCTGTQTWQSQVTPYLQYVLSQPLESLAAGDGYLIVESGTGLTAFKGSGTPSEIPNCATGQEEHPAPPTVAGSAPSAPDSGSGSAPASPGGDAAPTAVTHAGPSESPVKLTLVRDRCRAARRVGATCTLTLVVPQAGTVTVQLTSRGHVVATARARVGRRRQLTLTLRPRVRASQYRVVVTLHAGAGTTVRRTLAVRA